MEKRLAIIIPAYKPDFLKEALQSIEHQTNSEFQVYIGDDASPSDLWTIAQPFVERNGWVFKRFESNQGRTDLIAHWNRCVALCNESWIWLFSDDDVMGLDCVSTFMKKLETKPSNQVFRFPFSIIDKDSNETETPPMEDKEEISGFDFGKSRFERKLLSSAVEFIFSRDAYIRNGGFVHFPFAWCSDDASWIAFSEPGMIGNLSEGRVYWRLSDNNISSQAGSFTFAKLEAAASFIVWFNSRYKAKVDGSLFGEEVIWFRLQLEQLAFEPGFLEAFQWTSRLRPAGIMNFIRTMNEIYARSYCSNRIKEGKEFKGFRHWISANLPKF
jgi:glycosyltransferase involved in cell wall biosynthesis